MPINTEHPEYIARKTRWQLMADALADEQAIKDAGTTYLPKTAGMLQNDYGDKRYEEYKARARFPEITTHTLTGIVGIIFEQDPVGVSDKPITRDGQTNLELARDIVRAVTSFGRDILVVDAPRKREDGTGGGEPFITRYSAQSMVNWKVDEDEPGSLSLAVFKEQRAVADADEYSHDTETVYRKYQKVGNQYEVSLWRAKVVGEKTVDEVIEKPQALSVSRMPVVVVGSIDTTPAPDPIPLLPVARSAVAYYQKSANLEHGMYLCTQPTPWMTGITEDEYNKIVEQGYGSGSLWYLGQEGKAGFLQPSADWGPIVDRMDWEIKQAENYSVRLTRESTGSESGIALQMRAASQHASIYSISRATSAGINEAEDIRRVWAGDTDEYIPIELSTDFDPAAASEQMIAVINNAVNAGNAPKSVLFEAYRAAKLTELSDKELADQIETEGGNIPDDPAPVAPPATE